MIDLHQVQPEERLSRWQLAVPQMFPGITLQLPHKVPSRGFIQRTRVANSLAWLIDSSPTRVVYCPKAARGDGPQHISIMLQLKGSTQVCQGSRSSRLAPGEFCFIDNRQSFVLEVPGNYSRFVAWQLPRDLVLRHHPHIDRLMAENHDTRNHAASVVGTAMVQTLQASSHLGERQQLAALTGFIQMLGVLDTPGEPPSRTPNWRLAQALKVIDEHFTNPSLDAGFVAEVLQVSRRQLDRLFQDELNITVTGRIWERRLEQAAKLLRSPTQVLRSITDIALSCGFEDAAHFTRSFKKRFQLPPREWRSRHLIGPDAR